jgi:sec-independent protein translocase protein TatB
MFDPGLGEFILLFIIGLLILGPERLPKVAAQLGRWVGRARRTAAQLRRQLEQEINLNEVVRPATPPSPPKPRTTPSADATSGPEAAVPPQRPTASDQGPARAGQEPTTSGKEPTAADQQAEAVDSAAGQGQQAAGQGQPAAGRGPTAAGQEQASTGNEPRPATDQAAAQPAAEVDPAPDQTSHVR